MSRRSAAALILLVVFALLASVRVIVELARPGAPDRHQQELRDWHQRLTPLRALLPRNAVVGFQVEDDDAGLCYTQFDLAPVVVLPGTTRDFVISTFDTDSEPPPAPGGDFVLFLDDRAHGVMCWKSKWAK
jgi:hypothetical protein